MFRPVAAAIVAVVTLCAGSVHAQSASTSTTRSTSTTTEEGNTTRTVTRSTTVGGSVSVDGETLGEALAGALRDRVDPDEANLRRMAVPARTEDAFGEWRVMETGRDNGDCRFMMAERAGFLGVRAADPVGDCPDRVTRNSKWRVQQGSWSSTAAWARSYAASATSRAVS